jgi:hypothetical protein
VFHVAQGSQAKPVAVAAVLARLSAVVATAVRRPGQHGLHPMQHGEQRSSSSVPYSASIAA